MGPNIFVQVSSKNVELLFGQNLNKYAQTFYISVILITYNMVKKTVSRSGNSSKILNQLVENNIALQKKTTELLISVNNLTKKMDSMLSLFSKAAEHIEKGEVEEPLARKLELLLDQNRKIAKGLILLEKYVRDRAIGLSSSSFPPKALPQSEF